MKHLLMSFLLLTILIGFSVWAVMRIGSVTKTTAEMVTAILADAENDPESARMQIEQAISYWEKQSKLLCVILRHDQVDEVTEALAKLRASLEQDDFYTTCAEILSNLSHMSETEKPLLRNIL